MMGVDHKLSREMAAASALRESLATDDEDLVRDMIEGETGLHELIEAVFQSIQEDQEHVSGIKARETALKERRERFERSVTRKRAMLEQAMSIGEIKTLTLDEATLSLAAKARQVVIEDESSIPSVYWKTPAPSLDKAALKTALSDGKSVPGASLDNGGVQLTVRVK